MGMSRRTFLVAVTGLLAACATPQAQPAGSSRAAGGTTTSSTSASPPETWDAILAAGRREGKVLMYNNVFASETASKVAAAFQADTGIAFDSISILGGPATTRIQQESRVGGGPDIFEGTGGFLLPFAVQGGLVPLKSRPLPIWSEPPSVWLKHPGFKIDDWSFVLSRLRARQGNIVVNTSLVAPSDYPNSWHVMASDPRYTGKIAYLDPTAAVAAAQEIVISVYVAKTMTARDFADLLVTQQALLFKQSGAHYASVAQGERAVAFSAADQGVLDLISAGAPLKNLWFPNTAYTAPTGDMGVLTSAPHPNAALVFVNWFLSQAGQDAVGKLLSISSIRSDVADYTPAALKGEVIGSGQRGPMLVMSPKQEDLTAELQRSGIFTKLVDGSPAGDFAQAYATVVADWESRNGGPQDEPLVLNA